MRGTLRGAGFLWVFLVLAGLTGGAVLTLEAGGEAAARQARQEARSREAVAEAKDALLNYMLRRADSAVGIRQGDSYVTPRFLMLPCPDNVGGDGDLDGGQEGACGGQPPSALNSVNNVLDGGSRFGRLPWRTEAKVSSGGVPVVADGVDVDVRDRAGNRLWLAVSRNMVSARSDMGKRVPLNLHSLAAFGNDRFNGEWLRVVDGGGRTVEERAVAVILAPGPAFEARLSEAALMAATLEYARDVAAVEGGVNPARFFEKISLAAAVTVDGRRWSRLSNFSREGIFVQAPEQAGFNDEVGYIGLGDLWAPSFLRHYEAAMGVGEAHNASPPFLPLGRVQAALQGYFSLFGFLPLPARPAVRHVLTRQRHCEVYHTGAAAVTAVLGAGVELTPAAAVTAALAEGTVAVTMTAAFLLAAAVTVTPVFFAAAVVGDVTMTLEAVTLARFGRVVLTAAALAGGTVAGTATAILVTLAAGATVTLAGAAVARVAARTPLAPVGEKVGFLPQHNLPGQRAGNDGDAFELAAAARAMFWSPASLMETAVGAMSVTVTLGGGDVLTLPAGREGFVLEKDDFDSGPIRFKLKPFAVSVAEGAALREAFPDAATFARRQFVVWLLADAVSGSRMIAAPAVVFPWRRQLGSGADSRDNLHAFPPCFDARDFWGEARLKTWGEDQTAVYAVAADCHYGGGNCKTGGLTVTLMSGAAAALPRAAALSLSYAFTATVGGVAVTMEAGGVARGDAVLARGGEWALPAVDGAATLAVARLSAGFAFVGGETVTLGAGMTVVGGTGAAFVNVPGVLIFSPAPLARVGCTTGLVGVGGVGVANQRVTMTAEERAAEAPVSLCRWVDDEENADGDAVFVMHARRPSAAGEEGHNDYFLLLGGGEGETAALRLFE